MPDKRLGDIMHRRAPCVSGFGYSPGAENDDNIMINGDSWANNPS
jgi:hypothetical protein